jgi:hypothetical protein
VFVIVLVIVVAVAVALVAILISHAILPCIVLFTGETAARGVTVLVFAEATAGFALRFFALTRAG